MIGKRMQLSINEFYLVRDATDKQIKDINKTLTMSGLSDHSRVRIVKGEPEMEGAYKIQISSVKLTDDSGSDNKIFET